ncbi:MAG TPA: GNAT family N-acetyltransferase [Thermotogota bacterium]|nr:GNAT family N-acetyltransferase [Thermotogota bacterium]HRW34733.1 GNAT family N-acetyltransferase [Thermotogota bacterium]
MIVYQTDLIKICEDQLEGFFVGWQKPLTPKQHLEILKNSRYRVLALDTETKKVVGFVNALCDGVNFAFIPMLEVLPPFQKRGIGTRLMELMLKELEPFTCVDLTCDEQMQGFYQRFSMFKSQGMVLRKYLNHQKEKGV